MPCKNNDAIDALKLLMSIAVVAMHAEVFIGSYWLLILYPWVRMCVPLFFMISAYFFFRKHPDGEGVVGFVGRIVRLYVFWFVVTLPFTLIYRKHIWWQDDGCLNCIGRFIRSIFLGGTFGASWYLTALAIGVVLVSWLSRKFSEKTVWSVCLFGFLACAFTSNYWTLLPHDSPIVANFKMLDSWWPRIHTSFPASLIWVCLGRFVARHENQWCLSRKRIIVAVIGGAYLLWAEWIGIYLLTKSCSRDIFLFLPPICIAVFLLANNFHCRIPYAIEMRRASIVIFLVHLVIIAPLRDLGLQGGGAILGFVSNIPCRIWTIAVGECQILDHQVGVVI